MNTLRYIEACPAFGTHSLSCDNASVYILATLFHHASNVSNALCRSIIPPFRPSPIQFEAIHHPHSPSHRSEPSPEVRAALKVLHDSLSAPSAGRSSPALGQAGALVQAEWFRVSGTKNADPLAVEDYLDVFEEMSPALLKTVVNMADNNVSTRLRRNLGCGVSLASFLYWS